MMCLKSEYFNPDFSYRDQTFLVGLSLSLHLNICIPHIHSVGFNI